MNRRGFLKSLLAGIGAAVVPVGFFPRRAEPRQLPAPARQYASGDGNIDAGGWYHVMCFYDRDIGGEWYINGVEVNRWNSMTPEERRRMYADSSYAPAAQPVAFNAGIWSIGRPASSEDIASSDFILEAIVRPAPGVGSAR